MRMVIVTPPHTTTFWLKVTVRVIASKYPDAVVLGPVETRLHGLLTRYKVPIQDPPQKDPMPTGWWPRVKYWWAHRNIPRWDPWGMCDVVMILWDYSDYAKDGIRLARRHGKKAWLIRMTGEPSPVEMPMPRPNGLL